MRSDPGARLWTALLALLLAGATGCSGGGRSAGSAGAQSPSPAASAAARPQPTRSAIPIRIHSKHPWKIPSLFHVCLN